MKPTVRVRIGTRGSALARWQANHVKALIEERFPEAQATITIIKTSGDKILDAPFAEIGGKGVFVKEIEDALLEDNIDIAVHSMKDMPSELPGGLVIGAVMKRQSPYDALCSREGVGLDSLPRRAKIGTSSARRAAQLLHLRPDLTITPLRGNVDTRLRKLETEGLDSVVLAQAGLERMGFGDRITEVIPPSKIVPAPGQGIIAAESRSEDIQTREILDSINHSDTEIEAEAERAFLSKLGGGCQAPAGCLASWDGRVLTVVGIIASPDGKEVIREELTGGLGDNVALGADLAELILAKGGKAILAKVYQETS